MLPASIRCVTPEYKCKMILMRTLIKTFWSLRWACYRMQMPYIAVAMTRTLLDTERKY